MPTDQLSRTFAALADPTRRDLVARLTIGDATVGDLAAPYAMSLQAVSKHLGVLEKAGLVTRRKQAQRRPVHLEAEVLAPVTEWLETYRRRAEERYQRLDAVLAELSDTQAGSDTHAGGTR
jgi:DNA-binding transcriptional ArsR family regulator